MKAEVKKFLDSGLLEEYLLGLADEDKIPTIERYIRQYPEVKAEYEAMRVAMEQLALKHGIPPPKGMKEAILVEMKKAHRSVNQPKRNTLALAAGVAAMVFALAAAWFWIRTHQLNEEKKQLTADLEKLSLSTKQQAEQCRKIENQLLLLSDPHTGKFLLKGNQKALDFQIVAYWNVPMQQSFLHLTALPELPGKKCYQLWADVNGEMVSLGVLPYQTGPVLAIPFKLNATSLNVTIEPEGGSDHPTVADLVASVSI